jgi:hypothetical protein
VPADRPPTVRFYFHFGHPAALPRTAASGGQDPTHAPQHTAPLFDDLIGGGEQPGRHLDAERSRGLQVDGKYELGRLHDR